MTKAKEPYALTATEALRQIEEGVLSATGWVESCLERIREREPDVRAWAFLNGNVLDEVNGRWQQAGRPSVPIGIKDIIDVAGMPTMMGGDFHDPQPKTRDGGSVAILREAGFAFVGKTVTTELGHLHPGPTRNPHDLGRTPGGSSSGSAAAVGDMMVPLCLGTQTSGSVIRPAAYCGVIGYKPTYNDFDKTGILGNAPSMDTLGLIARSVDDISLLRGILLEEPNVGGEDIDFARVRFGILRASPWETADAEVHTLIETFANDLATHGSLEIEITLDDDVARLIELHRMISGYEFRRSIAYERFNHFEQLSAILREGRLADGHQVDNTTYQKAIKEVAQLRLKLAQNFEEVDILITPVATGPAPESLSATGSPAFNSAWSLAGNPVITLPLFRSSDSGLPIGCQLIAGFANDNLLLAVSQKIMSTFAVE